MISITAFGRVPAGRMVRRSGAQVGDRIAVTGTIGDAALGLLILKERIAHEALDAPSREFLIGRYRVPQPRNALAAAIRDHASAAMDVSDGLAGDLAKLCAASGVSAEVDMAAVPLSGPARAVLGAAPAGMETVVSGGDDYEVLCAIPENRWTAFLEAARQARVPVTAIGRSVDGKTPPRFLDARGQAIALKRLSYSHF